MFIRDNNCSPTSQYIFVAYKYVIFAFIKTHLIFFPYYSAIKCDLYIHFGCINSVNMMRVVKT